MRFCIKIEILNFYEGSASSTAEYSNFYQASSSDTSQYPALRTLAEKSINNLSALLIYLCERWCPESIVCDIWKYVEVEYVELTVWMFETQIL